MTEITMTFEKEKVTLRRLTRWTWKEKPDSMKSRRDKNGWHTRMYIKRVDKQWWWVTFGCGMNLKKKLTKVQVKKLETV